MTPVRWLRVSYWTGAVVDALAALAMWFPEVGGALYRLESFEPGADYRYAMRLGASLMSAWTLLLLWADRKPLERRGVLPITVLLIFGLASAGAYAVRAGLIEPASMMPTWVLQAILVVLFVYSYLRSRNAAADAAIPAGRIPLAEAAEAFLAQDRFAVVGVSRSSNAAANLIFKRLKETGREVYAINPNADTVEGERSYPALTELPSPPDAVVIAIHPDRALDVAQQCRYAGVRYVWFHRSVDGGSFSAEAAELCAGYGATVIPGGCPMMHLRPVDVGHRCMHAVLGGLGKLPKSVAKPGA